MAFFMSERYHLQDKTHHYSIENNMLKYLKVQHIDVVFTQKEYLKEKELLNFDYLCKLYGVC